MWLRVQQRGAQPNSVRPGIRTAVMHGRGAAKADRRAAQCRPNRTPAGCTTSGCTALPTTASSAKGMPVTSPRPRHGCGAACFVALMPVHPVVRLDLPAPSCRRGREGCRRVLLNGPGVGGHGRRSVLLGPETRHPTAVRATHSAVNHACRRVQRTTGTCSPTIIRDRPASGITPAVILPPQSPPGSTKSKPRQQPC